MYITQGANFGWENPYPRTDSWYEPYYSSFYGTAGGGTAPWRYNYGSGNYENWRTGEAVDPLIDYQRYKEVIEPTLVNDNTVLAFEGAYFFDKGKLYMYGELTRLYSFSMQQPASNSRASGRGLEVADDMLFHFSLTSSFISGVAESVKDLSPVAKRAFSRTSKTLGAIDLAITMQLARADGIISWGEKAKIGINGLIYLGTYNQYTIAPSIGLGIAEEYGAFDNWYSDWDSAQNMYNNYGVTILPLTNPFTNMPIIINRR